MRSRVALGALVLGCQAAPTAHETDAVVVAPDAAGRAELRRVVSQAVGGRPVTLADDALTRDSQLILERTPRQGPEGVRVPGRDVEEPERFRLVLNSDGQCMLVHLNTGNRHPLRDVRCRAKRE